MMAASARGSGTSSPFASVLNFGSATSAIALACEIERARASFARRARAAEAEYEVLRLARLVAVAFFAAGLLAAGALTTLVDGLPAVAVAALFFAVADF